MHEFRMHDWGYETVLEPGLGNRRIGAMRGKVLGGPSSINMMAYTRGSRGDYDRWAQKGAPGWSYADVLPYFKRGETWQDGANAWRGATGPLGTEFAKTRDPLFDACMDTPFRETAKRGVTDAAFHRSGLSNAANRLRQGCSEAM